MSLSIKFFVGIIVGCVGFLASFVVCAMLSCPTNIMVLPCVSFLMLIICCFIGFFISYNNIKLNFKIPKYKLFYNKNKSNSMFFYVSKGY